MGCGGNPGQSGTSIALAARDELTFPKNGRARPVLVVRRETPDQPDVLAFLAEADERSASLYPAESRHGLDVAALLAADVRFFVARRDGRALGCGGYVLLPGQGAEMKRLFVAPNARGRGIGDAVIRAIEQAAAGEGVRTLFLETGVKSFEALRLYGRHGFAECGPFAAYQPDPLSVFMVKPLAGGEPVNVAVSNRLL